MRTAFRVNNIIIAVICICFFFVERAEAYIDPGTGSMILQATIGAIVGSAVALKLFWNRIKFFFVRLFGKNKTDNVE
jgi:hypothetical protein